MSNAATRLLGGLGHLAFAKPMKPTTIVAAEEKQRLVAARLEYPRPGFPAPPESKAMEVFSAGRWTTDHQEAYEKVAAIDVSEEPLHVLAYKVDALAWLSKRTNPNDEAAEAAPAPSGDQGEAAQQGC